MYMNEQMKTDADICRHMQTTAEQQPNTCRVNPKHIRIHQNTK